jgi:ATP-binding cassette, subfamily B, multidrug efflux pump
MVGPAVMYTASTGLTFVVALALMVSIHPWLTIIAVLPLPFVSLAVRYFGRETHDRFERIQAQLSTMSAVTQESLAGVRVVRAYRQEPFEIARFRAASEEYLRRNRALVVLQAFYFPSMGFLMGLGALLVLWLGSRETIAGRLTIGELVAFNGYLMMLAWPMIAFGWVTNLLQRGMASWRRMLEVIDVEPSITDAGAGGWQGRAIRGDIEFRALTVGYGDRVVLRDVSARLPAGTITAIVGATGSGKSTLLHVLPRLHEAPAGTVFIDGTDVRRIPLAVLRGAIGMVTQEPFLFSASLAENIALGTRGSQGTRERVRAAAQVAGLEPDLAALPAGLDTVIGERGITLSGGQKQRVAMARALVPDPPILILDDALSAVDTETEERILQGLRGVMAGRTTILVSHRVSTVRHADRILVLDAGRIVEQGTHDELVGRGGVYADLHRRQLLEDELEVS